MKKPAQFQIAFFAVVASATLFAVQSASASTIEITDPSGFTSPYVVDSSNGSVTIDNFLVTNTTTTKTTKNNSYTVDIDSITASIGAHSDNPSDLVTSVAVSGGSCTDGTILAEGKSCTVDLTLDFAGGAPSKSHPNSYGINDIKLTVDAFNPQGENGNTADDSSTFKTEVVYTPEPSSLMLFGSGLLGLAGALRRKLGRG
jgi:hypothetical protein